MARCGVQVGDTQAAAAFEVSEYAVLRLSKAPGETERPQDPETGRLTGKLKTYRSDHSQAETCMWSLSHCLKGAGSRPGTSQAKVLSEQKPDSRDSLHAGHIFSLLPIPVHLNSGQAVLVGTLTSWTLFFYFLFVCFPSAFLAGEGIMGARVLF